MQGNEKRKENEDDYCTIMPQALEKPHSEKGGQKKILIVILLLG
jgi:hypothetical protein